MLSACPMVGIVCGTLSKPSTRKQLSARPVRVLPLSSGIYILGIGVGGINLPVIFLRCCKSDLISQKQPVSSPAYISILIIGKIWRKYFDLKS